MEQETNHLSGGRNPYQEKMIINDLTNSNLSTFEQSFIENVGIADSI